MAKQCNTVDFSRRETADHRSGVTKQGEGDGQPEGRLQRLGGRVGERGKKESDCLTETLRLGVAASRSHIMQWLV